METRHVVSAQIKAADAGEVRAIFATLNVVDKDGDLTIPGAFGEQNVIVSAYGHSTWKGALPVGKGRIYERGNEAIADLQFFLGTESGRAHFDVIKELGPAQEYSYGFDILDHGPPDEEQRARGAKRILKALKVHEVSPVFKGAGVGTRTLVAKTEAELGLEMIKEFRSVLDHAIEADAVLTRLERREAARKAVAVLPPRALRAAFGDLARIHVRSKGWPPFDGIPNQHVVVTTAGKVYRRSISAPEEWTQIR